MGAMIALPEKAVFYNDYVSSDGLKTTSGANTVITFSNVIINLQIVTTDDPINIKINDNTNKIYIPANTMWVAGGIKINKFTIVENGVEYAYAGMIGA